MGEQDYTSVTSMGLRSLPSGTTVLYMTPKSSPVFMIKFCQVPALEPASVSLPAVLSAEAVLLLCSFACWLLVAPLDCVGVRHADAPMTAC